MSENMRLTKAESQQVARDMIEAHLRIAELDTVLKFYASEWRINGDGDSETPGLSRSWMEPTDALFNDEGRKAREALKPQTQLGDNLTGEATDDTGNCPPFPSCAPGV